MPTLTLSLTPASGASAAALLPAIPSTAHANGMRHYDTHNLFGTGMAMNHHASFKAVTGKRPFLLSRYALQFEGCGYCFWAQHGGRAISMLLCCAPQGYLLWSLL